MPEAYFRAEEYIVFLRDYRQISFCDGRGCSPRAAELDKSENRKGGFGDSELRDVPNCRVGPLLFVRNVIRDV